MAFSYEGGRSVGSAMICMFDFSCEELKKVRSIHCSGSERRDIEVWLCRNRDVGKVARATKTVESELREVKRNFDSSNFQHFTYSRIVAMGSNSYGT